MQWRKEDDFNWDCFRCKLFFVRHCIQIVDLIINRIFFIGCLLFLVPITIILSLIPVYLSNSRSTIDVNKNRRMYHTRMSICLSLSLLLASVTYRASYGTNLDNGHQLDISDTSFLPDSVIIENRKSLTIVCFFLS